MVDLRGSTIPRPVKVVSLSVQFWFGFRASGGSDPPFKRHMWPTVTQLTAPRSAVGAEVGAVRVRASGRWCGGACGAA
jgi:hypothetical protein